jgi:hypothetical protein
LIGVRKKKYIYREWKSQFSMEKNIYPNKISFLKTNLILLSLGEDSLKSSHIIRKNNKVFLNWSR